jgi:hypothetical protein
MTISTNLPRTNRSLRGWTALLARTFGLTVETCPNCGGKMRIVAALTDPASIRRYLEGVGLSADIPTSKIPSLPASFWYY